MASLSPIYFLTPSAAVPGLAAAFTKFKLTVTKAHCTQKCSFFVPNFHLVQQNIKLGCLQLTVKKNFKKSGLDVRFQRIWTKDIPYLSNFVCPITGADTNGVERVWRPLKEEFRAAHHVTLDVFDAHLHCWRHRYQMKRDGMRFDRIYDNILQCLS